MANLADLSLSRSNIQSALAPSSSCFPTLLEIPSDIRSSTSITDQLSKGVGQEAGAKLSERQWLPKIDAETYKKVEDAYMQDTGAKQRPNEKQLQEWVKNNFYKIEDALTGEGPLAGLKKDAFIAFGTREPSLKEQQEFVKQHKWAYIDPLDPGKDEWEVTKFIEFGTSHPSEDQMRKYRTDHWRDFVDPIDDRGESLLKNLVFTEVGSNPSEKQKQAFIARMEKENGLKVYEKPDGSLTLVPPDSALNNPTRHNDRSNTIYVEGMDGVNGSMIHSAITRVGIDNGFRVKINPGNANYTVRMNDKGEVQVFEKVPSSIEVTFHDSKGDHTQSFATKEDLKKFLKESGLRREDVSVTSIFNENPPKERVVASTKIDPATLDLANGNSPTGKSGMVGEALKRQAQVKIGNQIAQMIQSLD